MHGNLCTLLSISLNTSKSTALDTFAKRLKTGGTCPLGEWWKKAKSTKDQRQWLLKAKTYQLPEALHVRNHLDLGRYLFGWLIRCGRLPTIEKSGIEVKTAHTMKWAWET